MCESSFCYTEECEKLKHMDYDLLGNRILEALTEEDNSVREIGKSVISCFEDSISEVEFDAKNQILIAMTGYSLQEFLVSVGAVSFSVFIFSGTIPTLCRHAGVSPSPCPLPGRE